MKSFLPRFHDALPLSNKPLLSTLFLDHGLPLSRRGRLSRLIVRITRLDHLEYQAVISSGTEEINEQYCLSLDEMGREGELLAGV